MVDTYADFYDDPIDFHEDPKRCPKDRPHNGHQWVDIIGGTWWCEGGRR